MQQQGKITAEQMALLKQHLADEAAIPLPQLEKIAAENLPPSHLAALGIDTGLRQNQLDSISALRDIAANGGMSLDDRVQQEAANSRSEGVANRGIQGLNASLAARGQLNSGAQLQTALGAQQTNANNARQSGMEAAASAQKRKLDALREIGAQSGSLRNQDYSEKSAAAQAADQRDLWNATSQQKAQYYNAQLPQQNFQNQIAKVNGTNAGVNALSGALGANAANVGAQYAGLGKAAYGAASALGGEPTRGSYNYDPDPPGGPGGGVPTYVDDQDKTYSSPDEWKDPWGGGE